MRVIVVGLGIQGRKRLKIAGSDVVGTVDPVVADANYRRVEDVPPSAYDAALVCTPDDAKIQLLHYLLSHGKHVLVEKPLLGSTDELLALKQLADSRKLACYTAYNHRFEPHIVNVRRVIESGKLGRLYLCRIFYGNGTARDVRNSPWRDKGFGVLPDLGSHLLDTMLFLFGNTQRQFTAWAANCFENRAFDHVHFGATGEPFCEFEATLLSWRNTFTFDLFGERGSAHINCLCKWGPSRFIVRQRVLPSGRPSETGETLECPDPTWELEYRHFANLCATGGTNIENDLYIQAALKELEKQWQGKLKP